jgi:hypothetical protein
MKAQDRITKGGELFVCCCFLTTNIERGVEGGGVEPRKGLNLNIRIITFSILTCFHFSFFVFHFSLFFLQFHYNTVEELDKIGLVYFRRKLCIPVWAIGPLFLAVDDRSAKSVKETGITPEQCIEFLDHYSPVHKQLLNSQNAAAENGKTHAHYITLRQLRIQYSFQQQKKEITAGE